MTTNVEQHPLIVAHRAWLKCRPAVFKASRLAEMLRELYRDERSEVMRIVDRSSLVRRIEEAAQGEDRKVA